MIPNRTVPFGTIFISIILKMKETEEKYRREYAKPSLSVIELQHSSQLLQVSTNLDVTYTEQNW